MKKEFKCQICEYEWKSRMEDNPKACPRCKRYDWNKNVWKKDEED